jgi:hypothetical protein
MDWTKSDWQWIYDENENNGYGMLISSNITVKELEFFNKIEGIPFITEFTLD